MPSATERRPTGHDRSGPDKAGVGPRPTQGHPDPIDTSEAQDRTIRRRGRSAGGNRTLPAWGPGRYTGFMTGPEIMILGKLLLTFGGLLAFGFWELHRLNRDR